jgi:hypothetical protein
MHTYHPIHTEVVSLRLLGCFAEASHLPRRWFHCVCVCVRACVRACGWVGGWAGECDMPRTFLSCMLHALQACAWRGQ